ncbi:DNA repair protein RAD5B-like isoform X2 [Henckelia pumila]|uniref:DNA repair protein RAD5B-like isoform X2 n=1 Tax=Henckelia pumila TaxID=405737 RepID=UPI003C6E9AF5
MSLLYYTFISTFLEARSENLRKRRKDCLQRCSFYIHHSIFTESDLSSWKLEPSHNATTCPLLTLFKLLKVDPFQKE